MNGSVKIGGTEMYYAAFGKVLTGMETADKIVNVRRDFRDKPLEDQRIKSIRVEIIVYLYAVNCIFLHNFIYTVKHKLTNLRICRIQIYTVVTFKSVSVV